MLLHDLTGAEVDRMVELMGTYRDRPMDLADASVVATAEHLGMRRLFALDRDLRGLILILSKHRPADDRESERQGKSHFEH